MYQRFDANLIRSKNDPGRRMQNMYDAWDYKNTYPFTSIKPMNTVSVLKKSTLSLVPSTVMMAAGKTTNTIAFESTEKSGIFIPLMKAS